MNLQLYVENQLCDFDQNTYFTLQKEFEDEAELIVKEVEYSYTISIPTSINNKRIFGFIDTFDVANKFSRIYDAELYVDEILILKGKLKLSEIDSEYFKGNLYNPASATVSDILGDRQLNEIVPHYKPMNNLSDYTQQNNYVMNSNSTDIPIQKYRDRHVCYPYVLYNIPYNDAAKAASDSLDFYTQKLDYGYHTINSDNIFPSFNVCSVLKDMFKTEGYSLQGNIFEDEKFKDLYQTFQYNYSEYLEKKLVPYYVKFMCSYDNYRANNIPSTLETATIWNQDEVSWNSGTFDGNMNYGVDDPLTTDDKNVMITEISNDQHMLSSGVDTNGKMIYVPRSGWYRIHVSGRMQYPDTSDRTYEQENREFVGGCKSGRGNSSLSNLPFEFQIKKGYPLESPKLYSFNSFIPCMPTHFGDGMTSVVYDGGNTWIKCMDNERNRLYGKNGKTTYIRDYSDFSTNDFVCGARLGGANFSAKFCGYKKGPMRDPLRFATRGSGLALPDVTKTLIVEEKGDNGNKYFKINSDGDANNKLNEYAEKTAQVLVRQDSFSNFEGYNKVDFNTKTWDTTSNILAVSYAGAANSSASTSGDTSGNWEINTVVWLERGDTLYTELLMPLMVYPNDTYHGGWLGTGHKRWEGARYRVVRTMCDFTFEMGIINTNKKWTPTVSNPIPSFNDIQTDKETNVNQFLPTIKCNDYLNNFLQTFNLQLTMPMKNTFSIDYAAMNNVMGNVISIEDLTNVKDAQFKALDTPSQRQLNWKIDTSETGYVDGNKSPYKTENLPWYDSGYTGSIIVSNETNTSGSIDKKESQWSYNWYKDIKFENGLGLSISGAPISVLSDAANWNDDYSYGSAETDALNTSKTMRFFFLGKDISTTLYKYIEFKYDVRNGRDLNCRLVIPSNHIETKQSDNSLRYYMLDYNNSIQNTNDGKRKTITDIFFNLYVQSGYQIDVPIKLTNDLYRKINAGTLIKFNDGLYKVKAIDGHDVSEQEDATLSLLTLK